MLIWSKRIFFALLIFILLFLLIPLGVLGSQRVGAYRAIHQRIRVTPHIVERQPNLNHIDFHPQATATAAAMSHTAHLTLQPIVAGLEKPTYLTHAFDDRLFVTERAGRIRIIEAGNLLPTPFLDITDRVDTEVSEQGLLNIAFHPHFHNETHIGYGRFYINYTNLNDDIQIVRYQVDVNNPNLADTNTETTLLTIAQPYARHNGGQLAFGPDGYLYIGVGDGGNLDDIHKTGQNPSNLLGTILRLDVDTDKPYAIPSTNPFVNNDDVRNEIWAYGLRNPWRFSFDRLTGDLYIGDVGQFGSEELNVQPANSKGGENYGWSIMEGNDCFKTESCDTTALTLPALTYNHSVGCSITGGYVYRGQQFPNLAGTYFLGDFCQGFVWGVHAQEGVWQATQRFQDSIRIATFGEDAQGELYILGFASGTIYQLQASE